MNYTIEDIYTLPDGQRAELINGQMYMMAPPNTMHQKISWKLHQTIGNYIDSAGGSCDVLAAPFAVFLEKDDYIDKAGKCKNLPAFLKHIQLPFAVKFCTLGSNR